MLRILNFGQFIYIIFVPFSKLCDPAFGKTLPHNSVVTYSFKHRKIFLAREQWRKFCFVWWIKFWAVGRNRKANNRWKIFSPFPTNLRPTFAILRKLPVCQKKKMFCLFDCLYITDLFLWERHCYPSLKSKNICAL